MEAGDFNVFEALRIDPSGGYDVEDVAKAVTERVRNLNNRINSLSPSQRVELSTLRKVQAANKDGQGPSLFAAHASAYAARKDAERKRQSEELRRHASLYAPSGIIDAKVLHDLVDDYNLLSESDILTSLNAIVSSDVEVPKLAGQPISGEITIDRAQGEVHGNYRYLSMSRSVPRITFSGYINDDGELLSVYEVTEGYGTTGQFMAHITSPSVTGTFINANSGKQYPFAWHLTPQ